MNIRRQIQLLRLLCGAVVLAACVGVFTTGAWAFNTQTIHTPAETLSLGTFSVCVANAQPDEAGTYHLAVGEYSVTLQAQGNMPSLVLTSWTPEGEQARLYYIALDPTTAENSALVIPISTGKPLALTLTPVREFPETWEEIPEEGIVVEAPEPAEETTQPSETTSAAGEPGETSGETAAENGQSQESTAETPTTSEPPATGETGGETTAGNGQPTEPSAEPSETPETSEPSAAPDPPETPATGGESTASEQQAPSTDTPQPQAAEGADSPGEAAQQSSEAQPSDAPA